VNLLIDLLIIGMCTIRILQIRIAMYSSRLLALNFQQISFERESHSYVRRVDGYAGNTTAVAQ